MTIPITGWDVLVFFVSFILKGTVIFYLSWKARDVIKGVNFKAFEWPKELIDSLDTFIETVLGFFTAAVITSERRIVNQERENRADHRVMMAFMRLPEPALPKEEDLRFLNDEEVILDVETISKVKETFLKAKNDMLKAQTEAQNAFVNACASVVLYAFIAIFVAGL